MMLEDGSNSDDNATPDEVLLVETLLEGTLQRLEMKHSCILDNFSLT